MSYFFVCLFVLVAALARDSSKAKDFSLLDLRLEAIRGKSFIRGTEQLVKYEHKNESTQWLSLFTARCQ